MVKVMQDQQRLLNQGMASFALDVRDKTDATGVMFIRWRIQALPGGSVQVGAHEGISQKQNPYGGAGANLLRRNSVRNENN
jgi:hypothetical protein